MAASVNQRALAAEFTGAFTVVAAIVGAGLFSTAVGGGTMTIAYAAGLAVLAMAFSIGHVSGGHFNPAVTLGLVAGGRFEMGNALWYVFAQLLGGLAAAFLFSILLAGAPTGAGAQRLGTFAAISNTVGGARDFSLLSVFLIEAVATALLLVVIMGATSKRAPAGFAPIAIGLATTLLYLLALPISNASLNPARSTATAVLGGPAALASLWVFWVAPIVGAVAGGIFSKWLQSE